MNEPNEPCMSGGILQVKTAFSSPLIGTTRKRGPGGTVNPLSLESLNCRSVGSSGLSCCLSLLAARAMFSGFAIAGQGSSSGISSSNTLLTMADAGLNRFSRAICGKKIQYN